MIIFNERKKLTPYIKTLKSQQKTIGFIPTMGALHQGHISLVKASIAQNDYTIVSIFVNPTQFNNPEDLQKYPRTESEDVQLLTDYGCDFVYLPSTEDLYQPGEEAKKYDFNGLDLVMEGQFRPGHFDGVATIVSKLIKAVDPSRIYFGEKDFQQIRIVQEMAKQEGLDVEIVPMPIHRAENGLALSSRNTRLTPKNLDLSPQLYAILQQAVQQKKQGQNPAQVKQFVEQAIENSPFELEYFEITDEENLNTLHVFSDNIPARGFLAIYAGDIRLIDNIQF